MAKMISNTRSGNRLRDRRGAAAAFMAVMIVALLGVMAVAVDVTRLMATRAELQTAVDAAALAGGLELAAGSGDVSRDTAIAYGARNYAENEPVAVAPEDVVFGDWDPTSRTFTPLPGAAGADAVHVRTRKEVTNWVAWALNIFTTSPVAEAIAWAEAPVSETKCVKPWSIPEELLDLNNDGTVTQDEVDYAVNSGQEFTLKSGTDDLDGSGIPSFFYAVVLPPFYDASTGEYRDVSNKEGASNYRDNIAHCDPDPVGVGDSLTTEPGEMGGPTIQGTRELCGVIIDTYCNPAGTYSPDGQPGMPIAATFWDSDVDPIGRKNVEVASLGSFRVLRAWQEPVPDDYAVVVGRFESMIATGAVSGEASTIIRTILVW